MSRKRILIFAMIFISAVIYYQTGYKRHILTSGNGEESITIWMTYGNKCYIIPGKYYSPFKPSENFIVTKSHRNYMGIIWKANTPNKLELSLYNEYELEDLDDKIKVYSSNESMLKEYNILQNVSGNDSVRSFNSEEISKVVNYEYYDFNRFYGIKKVVPSASSL